MKLRRDAGVVLCCMENRLLLVISLNAFDNFCKLELTMMDDDFGLDEKIGVQEVELDDLPVDEHVRKSVTFNEV